MDFGAALQLAHGGITLSAVVVNALGSMTWDASRMYYSRTIRADSQTTSGSVVTALDSTVNLKTSAAIAADPQANQLRSSLLANADFARVVRVGFALTRGELTVAADGQLRLKEGLDQQSSKLLAAGVEYRLLSILPLRVGASSDFAGATTLSAGTGIQLLASISTYRPRTFRGRRSPGSGSGSGWD